MNEIEMRRLLNESAQDELTALPGIGPALADRIMEARPFETLEDLQNIKGIGPSLLERLSAVAPVADLESADIAEDIPASEHQSQAEEKPPVAARLSGFKEAVQEKSRSVREWLSGLGKTISKQRQAARQTAEALPQKFEQTVQSRGQLWLPLVNSVVTALVAILLTLAILGGINGSLKFATGSQYRMMQREISQLSGRADALQKDLTGLRERVNAFEGLGKRTVALEKNQKQLTADLEIVSQQVSAMQAEVTTLNEKIILQEERTQRFEIFLKDLRTMLDNLFNPKEATNE